MLHAPVPMAGTLPAKVTVPTLAQIPWSGPAFEAVTGVTHAPHETLVTVAVALEVQPVALFVTVTLYVPAPTVTDALVLMGGFHE